MTVALRGGLMLMLHFALDGEDWAVGLEMMLD